MNATTRKKQPDKVRRQLLDAAAMIATETGVAEVTVDSVCRAAAVTKGAFFHHFPTKAALIAALFEDLIERFGHGLNEAMAADPKPHGRFTRAYLNSVAQPDTAGSEPLWAALCLSSLTDANLRKRWGDWFRRRLAEEGERENDEALASVRLAADGLWLADICGTAPQPATREALLARLRDLTYGKDD